MLSIIELQIGIVNAEYTNGNIFSENMHLMTCVKIKGRTEPYVGDL